MSAEGTVDMCEQEENRRVSPGLLREHLDRARLRVLEDPRSAANPLTVAAIAVEDDGMRLMILVLVLALGCSKSNKGEDQKGGAQEHPPAESEVSPTPSVAASGSQTPSASTTSAPAPTKPTQPLARTWQDIELGMGPKDVAKRVSAKWSHDPISSGWEKNADQHVPFVDLEKSELVLNQSLPGTWKASVSCYSAMNLNDEIDDIRGYFVDNKLAVLRVYFERIDTAAIVAKATEKYQSTAIEKPMTLVDDGLGYNEVRKEYPSWTWTDEHTAVVVYESPASKPIPAHAVMYLVDLDYVQRRSGAAADEQAKRKTDAATTKAADEKKKQDFKF